MTIPRGPAVEIKRRFEAEPQRVFDAWLTREEWQAWIGPEGVDCDVPVLDARVGGRYRLIMHLPGGRAMPVVGQFVAIDPPNQLAFTWGAESGDGTTLVTLDFRAVDGGTELSLRHEGLPGAAEMDDHFQGWNSALNKLAAFLARSSWRPS